MHVAHWMDGIRLQDSDQICGENEYRDDYDEEIVGPPPSQSTEEWSFSSRVGQLQPHKLLRRRRLYRAVWFEYRQIRGPGKASAYACENVEAETDGHGLHNAKPVRHLERIHSPYHA